VPSDFKYVIVIANLLFSLVFAKPLSVPAIYAVRSLRSADALL